MKSVTFVAGIYCSLVRADEDYTRSMPGLLNAAETSLFSTFLRTADGGNVLMNWCIQ